MLKHRSPDTDVTIYYIDIQNFDKAFTPLRKELEQMGVKFVRGVPFKAEQDADTGVTLYIEGTNGDGSIAKHDTVVLSVGLGPAEGSRNIADMFGLERDEFGFLGKHGPVFVSGTCREPQSIPDSMSQARAVALEITKSLGQNDGR